MFLCFEGLKAQKPTRAEIKCNEIKALIPKKINTAEKMSIQFLDEGIAKSDQEVIARSNYLLGLIHYYRSVYYISNKYYAAALQTKFANQNLSFKEACLNNMGINYEIQNMLPKAITAYNESLKIAKKLKDSTSIYESMINLGLLNAKAKKYNLALYNVNEAIKYFERQNDKANMALCYENLSFISTDFHRHEESIVYSNKALALFIATKDEFKIASCYYNLSLNYLLNNEPQKAEILINKAKTIIDKFDFKEELAIKIYIQVAEIEIEKNNFADAEANLKSALHLCQISGANENIATIYASFLNLYAKSGNYQKYSNIKKKADREEDLNTQLQSYARVDELRELYQFEVINQKIKNQEKDINAKQELLTISIFVMLGFLIVFIVLMFMYIRMRNYTKSLFENIVEHTAQDTLINESITDLHSRNKYLFSLFNQILVFIKDQKNLDDITIQEISEFLAADENDIANAISLFGNKDFKAFLNNYFIDQICKKIIKKGKKISIQKLISDSPFKNEKELQKYFKEITGLSVEQFIVYSEQKLVSEKT
jgi:tetratricopeptide (TPR) repeat protein